MVTVPRSAPLPPAQRLRPTAPIVRQGAARCRCHPVEDRCVTTPSNGDRGRIVCTAERIVQASNPRGLRLVGEQEYRNFSKYVSEPLAPPLRGQHVTLRPDGDGFVRELHVEPGVDAGPAESPDRERQIRRQVAAEDGSKR